jgi:hypothetical protein
MGGGRPNDAESGSNGRRFNFRTHIDVLEHEPPTPDDPLIAA